MFTAKYIGLEGSQRIIQAHTIEYHGPYPEIAGGDRVLCFDADGRLTADFQRGVVYVMNEGGATVAKYDLYDGPRGVPIEPVQNIPSDLARLDPGYPAAD